MDKTRILLHEVHTHPIRIAEEKLEEGKSKPAGVLLYIEGVAAQAGIVNHNNRLYPVDVFKNAVENAQESVSAGKFLGEVDHDWWGGTLARAAIRFTDLWMEDDLVKYKGVVMDTEWGRTLKDLLVAGVGIGTSTRGYGTVEYAGDSGIGIVQNDFELEGIDAVLEESNPAATTPAWEGKVGFTPIMEGNTLVGFSLNKETYMKITDTSQNIKEGLSKMEITTVEQLRTAYPDLVKQVEEAAVASAKEGIEKAYHEAVETNLRGTIETELKTKYDTELETKIAEAKETTTKEIMESEAALALNTLKEAVIGAVKPFMVDISMDEETKAKVAALETKLADAEKAVTEATAAKNTAESAKTAAETAAAEAKAALEAYVNKENVAQHLESKIANYEHAVLLRPRLAECKSIEEIDAKFEAEKAFIESIVSKLGTPAGQGQTTAPDAKDTTVLDEELQRQRKLAGLK